jgi:LmbE family N-acetylglucosaminyl deacetylase
MKKIMVIAAHPDDELLGCGGTLIKHSKNGDHIKTLILGQGMLSRGEDESILIKLRADAKRANDIVGVNELKFFDFPDNAFDSIPLLNIIKTVEKEIDEYEPDIIYTHFSNDLNVDHRRTFEAVMTATRPQPGMKNPEIYSFCIQSSTDWISSNESVQFIPSVFVDVEKEIEQKLLALEAYETEMKDYPHSRSLKSVEIFSQYWGTRVGKKYVEPFVLVRSVREDAEK